MRHFLVIGAAIIAAVVALPFVGFMTARNVSVPDCSGEGVSVPVIDPAGNASRLTQDQIRTAKIIWAEAHAIGTKLHGSADQAAVIAIAVASQESALGANDAIQRPNADGDAGIFQQRTLPGWYGSIEQVTDQAYAAKTFLVGHTVTAEEFAEAQEAGTRPAGPAGYHLPGLADVKGWPDLDIIEAAHQVQRSAFPDAVADDIPIARDLVDKFATGAPPDSPDAPEDDCGSPGSPTQCPPSGSPAEAKLKPDALLVLRCVKQEFPKITTFYGYRPRDPFPDHPSGKAVDIMISSAFDDIDSKEAVTYGTKIADWLKEHHAELGVQYLIYRQRIWNVERKDDGWRSMEDRGNPTANHMDHVHVTTYGNAAKRTDPPEVIGDAVTPIEDYTIAATFGQVGSWARYHTGLDFAAPIGTPVRAATAGTVTHAGSGGTAGAWAGNYVTIKHADGTSTLYAHLSSVDVRVDQKVTTGQAIGAIGVTGRSFGPHLHFETYPARVAPGEIYRAVDPSNWLRQRSVELHSPGSVGHTRKGSGA